MMATHVHVTGASDASTATRAQLCHRLKMFQKHFSAIDGAFRNSSPDEADRGLRHGLIGAMRESMLTLIEKTQAEIAALSHKPVMVFDLDTAEFWMEVA